MEKGHDLTNCMMFYQNAAMQIMLADFLSVHATGCKVRHLCFHSLKSLSYSFSFTGAGQGQL